MMVPSSSIRSICANGDATDAYRSFQIEYRLRRADGEYRWVLANGTPLYRGGEFTGYIGSCIDVTEQKMAQDRLRTNERRLIDAQRLAQIGGWERTLETDTICWSDEMLRILGLPNDPPVHFLTFLSRVHSGDREKIREADYKVRSSTGPIDLEYRIVRPDGEIRFVRSVAEGIRSDQGTPVRIVGATQDITDQKRAEATLRESEERFRNMADTAPVMIWVSGPDKGFTFVNKTWLDFTGRTMEQELGNGWAEGVHPEDLDRYFAYYSSSFDARRGFQIECRLRRADGEYRWVLCKGVPRFVVGGVFAGYIGSDLDITDQKRAEAILRRNLDEIAHLNRAAAMGELTASLAHELNQPLAAILSNAQAASRFLKCESPDLAQVRECLTDIAADDKDALTN